MGLAAATFGSPDKYTTVPAWAWRALGLVSPPAREIRELLPRYAHDNIFDATKFAAYFPDFRATTFAEGLRALATPSEPEH